MTAVGAPEAITAAGWRIVLPETMLSHIADALEEHPQFLPVVGLPHPAHRREVALEDLDRTGAVLLNGRQHWLVSQIEECPECGEDDDFCACVCTVCDEPRSGCGCDRPFDVADAFSRLRSDERVVVDHEAFGREVAAAVTATLVDPATPRMAALLDALPSDHGDAVCHPEALDLIAQTGVNPAVLAALCTLCMDEIELCNGEEWMQLQLLPGREGVDFMITTSAGWSLSNCDAAGLHTLLPFDMPETTCAIASGRPLADVMSHPAIDGLSLTVRSIVQKEGWIGRVLLASPRDPIGLIAWERQQEYGREGKTA